MSEEVKVVPSAPVVAQPAPTISDSEIKAVEQEIEVKDTAKLAKIKQEISAELSDIYSKKLIEELAAHKAKIEGEYSSKFVEVEKRLEEIKTRKGIASVPSETPYEQIQREEQKQVEAPRKLTREDLVRPSKAVDLAGAEMFLSSLRKR
jgi:hypothetical protein